ncbi:MAG: ParA family protein, partial [Chitinophagaceae bacterium]
MIILIGNKKGGTGKTTLTMLLAWYLSYLRHSDVQVIDMDERQNISLMAAKDRILENEPLYEVTECRPDFFPPLLESLGQKVNQVVLVDLPAGTDDEHYVPVLKSADVFLCPFGYDEFTMDATLLFAIVAGKVNPAAKIVFIPNRLKAGVRYELRAEADAT